MADKGVRHIKTASGFEITIKTDVFDNMELLDAIAELEEDPTRMSRVIRLLLGESGRKALYDHVRAEDGRVPTEAVSREVVEIFDILRGDLKK